MQINEESASSARRPPVALIALFPLLVATAACGGKDATTGGSVDAGPAEEAGTGSDVGGKVDAGAADATSDASLRRETSTELDAAKADVAETGQIDGPLGVPVYHRADDSQCVVAPAPGNCPSNSTGPEFMCRSDSQCIDGGLNGRCTNSGGGPAGCWCMYDACHTDTDCPAGELCVCHGSAYSYGGNACMPGNCRVDSDCGSGGRCSPAHRSSECGLVTGYYCHTRQDVCINDSDCASGNACTWSAASSRWECQYDVICPT